MSVAGAIITEHGTETSTYKIANKFLLERAKQGDIEELEYKFLNDICDCYLELLQKEHDYLLSDEAIIETFESNEYYFLEDGTIANNLALTNQ